MEIGEENSKIIEDASDIATNTIRICKEKGILEEYLSRKESEIKSIMMSTMLKQQKIELYAQQKKAEGIAEGMTRGKIDVALSLMKKGKLTEEEAAMETGMTIDDLRKAVAEPE